MGCEQNEHNFLEFAGLLNLDILLFLKLNSIINISIPTDPKDFAKVIRKIGDRVIIQREETKYQYSLGKYQ